MAKNNGSGKSSEPDRESELPPDSQTGDEEVSASAAVVPVEHAVNALEGLFPVDTGAARPIHTTVNINMVFNQIAQKESDPAKWAAQMKPVLEIARQYEEQEIALFERRAQAVIRAKQTDPDFAIDVKTAVPGGSCGTGLRLVLSRPFAGSSGWLPSAWLGPSWALLSASPLSARFLLPVWVREGTHLLPPKLDSWWTPLRDTSKLITRLTAMGIARRMSRRNREEGDDELAHLT